MKRVIVIAVVSLVVGLLVSSCKKENRIIGEWKLVSIEGTDSFFLGAANIRFSENDFFEIFEGDYSVLGGNYSIKYNTITFEYQIGGPSGVGSGDYGGQYEVSMKISFSGANKMKWKHKYKAKYTGEWFDCEYTLEKIK